MSTVRIEWLHLGIGQLIDRAGSNLPNAVLAVIPSFSVGPAPTVPANRPAAPGTVSALPTHAKVHALDGSVIVAWGSDPTAAEDSGLLIEPGEPALIPLTSGDKLSFIATAATSSLSVGLDGAVVDADGSHIAPVTTARRKWVDDFGGNALDPALWDVYNGGIVANGGSGVTGITYDVGVTPSCLVVHMGTTNNAELWFISKQTFTVPVDLFLVLQFSQRIVANNVWFELVEVDANGTLVPHASVAGEIRNRGGLFIGNSTTAGNFQIESTCDDSTNVNSVSGTGTSLTAMCDQIVEFRSEDILANNIATDGAGSKSTVGLRLSRQVPDPNKVYKLRMRFKNGTGPTATDVTVARVLMVDVTEVQVEVYSGRGDAIGGKSIPVNVFSTGTSSTSVQGPLASNANGAVNPVPMAVNAQSAQPTAATAGRLMNLQGDLAGRPIIKPGGQPQAHDFNRQTITATTETTLIAAVASNRHELQSLIIANRDNAAHTIDLRDASAGTIRQSFIVPPIETRQFAWPAGLPAAAVNTAWTVQLRESATTAVEISSSSYRTTA
jgi:hypothetical protein